MAGFDPADLVGRGNSFNTQLQHDTICKGALEASSLSSSGFSAFAMKLVFGVLLFFVQLSLTYVVNNGTECYLFPESTTHFSQPVDDSPSIQHAFELCGRNGTVIFTNDTFHVNQVLNTTGLANCNVSIQGNLVFSTNVPYWLSHSINVGLQNQSTSWLIGGENLTVGGGGLFDGNGQTWYTQNRNNSNQPGRPITMTFNNSRNLWVEDLSFIQPQFWATFVTYSQNVTMRNIYVNATSNNEWDTRNCDGADTWNSKDILIENWLVQNGDDCIAAKGNTTNLLVRNVTCIYGTGMTIGSVGQYPLMPDYNENIVFEDIRIVNSTDGAYIKTWQGKRSTTTLNGDTGGGGSGYVRNVTFRNFDLANVGLPIQISQCIYTESSDDGACDTSRMRISDVTFQNFTGTSRWNVGASIFCVPGGACPEIYFKDVDIQSVNASLGLPLYNTTLQEEVFQCANIVNQNTTSDIGCNRLAPNNFPQNVSMNVP